MNSTRGTVQRSRLIPLVVPEDGTDQQYLELRDCVLFVGAGCVLLATASSTHGVYCPWRGCELVLSPVEARVAGSLESESFPPKLDGLSVARFIQDDANLTPMTSLFTGISRLPGGSVALFSQPGREPVLPPLLASLENLASAKSRALRLASAVHSVAQRLVAEAGEKSIYIPVSGGIDGTVLLAALAKHGDRITAVYGDDGLLQHRINERLLSAIRSEFPQAKITYRFVKLDDIDSRAFMEFQRARLRWSVKRNHIKEGYKLALADFFVADLTSDYAFVVNSYCIDESCGGETPCWRSKHPRAITTEDVGVHSSHRSIFRLALERQWATWRIRTAFGEGDATQARRLVRRLSRTGKSGGVMAYRKNLSRANFERAITRDADKVVDLLVASIVRLASRQALARVVKLFSHYFVERSHAVRFFEHGRAMKPLCILPYADVDIRNALLDYLPRSRELNRPKQMLFAYLLEQCNVVYARTTRQALKGLPSPKGRMVSAVRAFAKRQVRIAFAFKQQNAHHGAFLHPATCSSLHD